MYKHFVPDEPDGGSIGFDSDQVPSAHSRGDIVPLYDEDGKFIAISFYYYFNYYSDIGEVTAYMLKPKKRIEILSDKVPSAHSRVPLYDEDGRRFATFILLFF